MPTLKKQGGQTMYDVFVCSCRQGIHFGLDIGVIAAYPPFIADESITAHASIGRKSMMFGAAVGAVGSGHSL